MVDTGATRLRRGIRGSSALAAVVLPLTAALVIWMFGYLGQTAYVGGSLAWQDGGWRIVDLDPDGPGARSGLVEGDRLIAFAAVDLERDDFRQGFDHVEDRAALRRWLDRNAERHRLWRTEAHVTLTIARADDRTLDVPLRIESLSWTGVLARYLPWLLVAASFIATALVVWRRAPATRARNAFTVAAVLVSGAILTYPGAVFGHVLAYPPRSLPWVVYLNLFSGSVAIWANLVFFLRFPAPLPFTERIPWVDRLALVASVPFGLLCLCLAATQWFPPGLPLMLALLVTALLIVMQFIQARRRADPTSLGQMRWIGMGVFAPTVAWIVLIEGPHAFRLGEIVNPDIVSLASIVIPISAGFAITRHRLLDVDLVIRRVLLVALVLLAFFSAYALAVRTEVLPELRRGSQEIVVLLVIGLLFLPLVARLEALFERVFRPAAAAHRRAVLELPGRFARTTSRGQLGLLLADTIADMLDTHRVVVLAAQEGDGGFVPVASYPRGVTSGEIPDDAPFLTYFDDDTQMPLHVRSGGALLAPVSPVLEQLDADIVLPMRGPLGMAGLVICGTRRDGKPHAAPGLRIAMSVTTQAVTYLENLRLVEELSELRDLERELARGQQRLALDTLSSEVAHEIRYPLNFFDNFLRFKAEGQPLTLEEIELGTAELERLRRLLQHLGGKGAPPPTDPQPTRLVDLARTCARVLEPTIGAGVRIVLDIPDELVVDVDRHALQQVLLNLLNNAAEAMGEGDIVLGASRGDGVVTLRVSDQGPGVPEADRASIFEPWFTSREDGRGLGLSICARIARRLGGRIYLDETSERGSTFGLDLPTLTGGRSV